VLEKREVDLTGRANVAERTFDYSYDHFDQVTQYTDAAGAITAYEYDAAGNKTAETNADALPSATNTTR